MTDYGVKRLILVSALEANVQGMIAKNKAREQQGLSIAYTDDHFNEIANEMTEIAKKPNDLL